MATVSKYRFDDFEADLRAAELRKDGTRLKLQLQPFQVLVALLERPKEVLTREDLRQRLWPEDTFVDFDHSLNTAMVKLRDVLGDSASSPKYIETIAKRGYRFLGNAEIVLEQPIVPAERSAAPLEVAQQPSAAAEQTASTLPEPDSELPRVSRNSVRLLFVLTQVMYLAFYLSALFSLDNTYRASFMAWHRAGAAVFTIFLSTAMVGLAVRLYLISATAMDYHLLGGKYRILMPALFVLDMLWALAPLLIADRIGLGFALGACAALIYMPFAQRTLMQMMQPDDKCVIE
jgi:cholera toxin transcriptional activator